MSRIYCEKHHVCIGDVVCHRFHYQMLAFYGELAMYETNTSFGTLSFCAKSTADLFELPLPPYPKHLGLEMWLISRPSTDQVACFMS